MAHKVTVLEGLNSELRARGYAPVGFVAGAREALALVKRAWGMGWRIQRLLTRVNGRLVTIARVGVVVAVAALVTAGCTSLSAQIAIRPPAAHAPASIAQDEAQCAVYAKRTDGPPNVETRYAACMIVRGYTANLIELDNTGFLVAVVQTRQHADASAVSTDIRDCDRVADNTRSTAVAVPLTAAQEASLTHIYYLAAHADMGMTGYGAEKRPKAARAFVACLNEEGYAVVPWVKFDEGVR